MKRRPWDLGSDTARGLGPQDVLLSFGKGGGDRRVPHVTLLEHGGERLRLHPYPKTGQTDGPPAIRGLPVRLPLGHIPQTPDEERREQLQARMHQVLARLEDLNHALADPEHLWARLRAMWDRAETDADPRMAEIVRQAEALGLVVADLATRLRRVLQRERARVPVDRAQEMDRASMVWLARQPGRSAVERAGPTQRVMAIARQENFNTLENRVLRAYVRLADQVAGQWMREHPRSTQTARFQKVASFARTCKRMDREFQALGIGLAQAGVTPNYVLQEDRSYRAVFDAWVLLLSRERAEDELWAWQAESWTDFIVLAVTLALHEVPGAQLVAQSPILYLDEADTGRRFLHDRPLAVFWLQQVGLVVEVLARPDSVSNAQFACGSNVAIKLGWPGQNRPAERVIVWPLHGLDRFETGAEAAHALQTLSMVSRIPSSEVLRRGIVIHSGAGPATEMTANGCGVLALGIEPSGTALSVGRLAIAGFVQSLVGEAR